MVTRTTHLCFINQFSKKKLWLASTASDRKGAKIQLDISWFYPKILFFQNIKIKLNSRTWMTLKSPIMIFQALEPLQPHFIKIFTDPDAWIISSTKMINTCPFSRNRSSKIQCFTNIWYSFCWRLLRPANATFLKTGWWITNGQRL